MDGAESLLRLAGGVLDRGAVGHVGHHRDRAGAQRAHFGERGVEAVAANVAEDDRHALARKGARQAQPDAGGRTGHDGGSSLELAHRSSSR